MEVPGLLSLLLVLQIFARITSGVQFSCGGIVCPPGWECLEETGTLNCVDPCQRYTVLEDDWRSTNNTAQSPLYCDLSFTWQGWYRLLLSNGSARIPEYCVDEYRCGTHAPMFLTTAHPTASGEIVERTVCNNWAGSCCYFGSINIHVKLCYEDYYIYKLVQPPTCQLAYCAEPVPPTPPDTTTTTTSSTTTAPPDTTTTTTSSTTTAPPDTTTTTTSSTTTAPPDTTTTTTSSTTTTPPDTTTATSSTTTTPPDTTTTTTSPTTTTPPDTTTMTTSPTTTTPPDTTTTTSSTTTTPPDTTTTPALPQDFQLICGRDKIQIGVNVTEMNSFMLDPYSGNLAVYYCNDHTENNGTVWYEVETVEGACGNILTTNATHIIYSNSLFIYPISNTTFNLPVDIPFSCAYPLDTDASLDVALKPFLDLNSFMSGSGDKAKAVMSLFHNASYTDKYPPGKVTLPVGSPLYVSVTVAGKDPRFVAVLEDCYATETPNPDGPVHYNLIQDKCPADPQLVSVTQSGTSLQARFTALFFLFQHNYNEVYLHCSLSLCDQTSSCVPSCGSRAKRAVSSSEPLKSVTIGPITWGKTPE